MRRVLAAITARPSYSRIRTALAAIEAREDLELQLVISGSALLDRYGSVVDQVRSDGFSIDSQVYFVLEGENPTSMAKTTGLALLELSTVFDNLAPDVVITVGDRYETLANAIAASYMNIPVAHIMGGEVSGSIDEKVRHAVTKLADVHFPATDLAAERLIRMGEEPATVHTTGCPSVDLAAEVVADPDLDFDPYERYGGVGPQAPLDDGYVVVMQHPVTTEHAEAKAHIEETAAAMEKVGLPVLWFWPNVDAGSDGTSKGLRTYREHRPDAPFQFFKNMAPTDFLRLIVNARALVGNSSVGIRESGFLGIPVVDIGNRQRGREHGPNVIHAPYDRHAIAEAVTAQVEHGRYEPDFIYGDGKAGGRIAALLAEVPLTFEKRLAY